MSFCVKPDNESFLTDHLIAPLPRFGEVSPEFDTVQGSVKVIFGRPNNNGSFSYLYTTNAGWTGGFQNLNGGTDIGWTASGSVAPIYNLTLGFNASWSNPIYGASNTNQPAAIRVLSLVKAY